MEGMYPTWLIDRRILSGELVSLYIGLNDLIRSVPLPWNCLQILVEQNCNRTLYFQYFRVDGGQVAGFSFTGHWIITFRSRITVYFRSYEIVPFRFVSSRKVFDREIGNVFKTFPRNVSSKRWKSKNREDTWSDYHTNVPILPF